MHPKLAEFKAALSRSGETHVAEMVAARGSLEHRRALRRWLQDEGLKLTLLRPPTPWEPLAPLRQLLESHGLKLPELAPEELDLETLWLGSGTVRTRLFLRMALLMGPHPTIAVVRLEDLNDPVWGSLLNYVRQGRMHMPVTFFVEADAGQRVPPVALRLDLDALPEDGLPRNFAPRRRGRGMARPGKRALGYLAQALFFGDRVQPRALVSLSQADGKRHLASLRLAGLVDAKGRLVPESLYDVQIPPLTPRPSWVAKAWTMTERRRETHTLRALWLRAKLPPEQPAGRGLAKGTARRRGAAIDESLACRAAVELGDRVAQDLLHRIPTEQLEAKAVAVTAFLGIERGHFDDAAGTDAFAQTIRSLGLPYGPLLVARLAMRKGRRDCGRQVTACRDKLKSAGHERFAAILSLELSRWHLAHWRVRPSLQAIGLCAEPDHWVVHWLRHIAMAEAYIKMERLDFARTHAQKALAAPPRPLSPLLKSDLYITMGQLFMRAGHESQAESAMEKARETYISARDAVRMGRYLIVRGEMYWRAKDMELAKQTYSRAIRILNELEAGVFAREAELKLALVLQGVAAETVGA